MATPRSIAFGSGTDNNEIDVIDVGALVILPMVVSIVFQFFAWQVIVFGQYDLTDPIWTIANADISVVLIVTVFSTIRVLATNLANFETNHSPYELAAIVVAIVLPLMYVFVPVIESLVLWHDLVLTQVSALLSVSGATVAVSSLG